MKKWLTVVFAILIFEIILVCAVLAHDHNRPDLNDWFPKLHSKSGTWCCDGPAKDALHLTDADWQIVNNHYRVKVPVDIDAFERARKGEAVDTVWTDVPDDAVIAEGNKYGSALVWPTYGISGRMVRCFMPGVET